MGRPPKHPLAELVRASREQLMRAKELGRSLDQRMKEKKAAADNWIPDPQWREDFQTVTTTLRDAGNSLLRALEGNKKDLGGLTEDQLQAQFRAEIVAAAQSMTDEDWQRMVAAREKAKR